MQLSVMRSILTMLGIIIGVAAVIILVLMAARRHAPPAEIIGQALFHCDAFGEIPWLIHVTPAEHGDVIGKQLERNDRQ